MTRRRIVIRADGGPEIGYGHLVRTRAVAEELLSRGHAVTYVTTTPGAVTEVCLADCELVAIASPDDSAALQPHIDRADVVLLDSYRADEQYQRTIRSTTPLAVFSDDARRSICADLLVNGNLYAPDLSYDIIGEPPTYCLGPRYLPLRESITRLSAQDPPWRSPPERAVVTMGGSDTERLTPTVIRAFGEIDVRLDVIVGPGFSDDQEREIERARTSVPTETVVIRDPPNLPELLFEADFAVTTASSTCYELMALGTPLIAYLVADNQEPIAAVIAERDLGFVVDNDCDGGAIDRALSTYVRDDGIRRTRRSRGRSLIDGRGTTRIATELLSVAALDTDS